MVDDNVYIGSRSIAKSASDDDGCKYDSGSQCHDSKTVIHFERFLQDFI